MPTFHYKALDEQQRSATGEISAATVRDAIESLEAKGFEVLSIGQLDAAPPHEHRPTSVTTSSLWHPFDKLFSHRTTLAPALAAYSEELTSGPVRGELERVVDLLRAGDVGEAVRSFDSLADQWTPLLSAAALHSQSHQVLSEYLRRRKDPQVYRQLRWSPLVYPLVLLVLAAVFIVAMSLMAIPTFRDIFEEFDLEIPPATQLVLQVAEAIRSGRVYIGMLVVVLVLLGVRLLVRHLPEGVRRTVSRWTLRRRRRFHLNGRLAGYVADLLQAGLSQRESLRQSAGAIDHLALAASATDLAERLDSSRRQDGSASSSLLTHSLSLAMEQEMSSASRIQLLRELSDDYTVHTTPGMGWKQQLLLGPITLVVVGVTVGFTVLALFMPLVRLVEGLS